MRAASDSVAPLPGWLERYGVRALAALAAVLYADLLAVAALYAAYPGFLDHGEPSTMLIGWRIAHGLPAYPPFDAPERITNIYGPLAYAPGALLMALFGPGLAAAKAWPPLAATAAALVVFLGRRKDGWGWAFFALILATAFTLLHLPAPVWNRPDSTVALAVAAAVLAMNGAEDGKPEHGRSVVIALLAGAACGAKLHAGLYFVPIALAHAHGRGFRCLLLMGGVGLFVILAPFALPPFSLPDYLSWFLPVAAAKPAAWSIFVKVFRYALFYLVPIAFFAMAHTWKGSAQRAREAIYVVSYAACIGISFVLASKPGAGIHYLYPFMPVAVDIVVRSLRRGTVDLRLPAAGAGALAVALLMVAAPIEQRYFRALHWEEARAIGDDLRRIMAANPGRSIEMGVGERVESYPKTWLRPLLVAAGNPYSFDAAIVTETVRLGIPLPRETTERIRACRTDLWLVPKGERPFAMTGYYGMPVFGEAFVETFLAAYRKTESFAVFDAWACRR